MGFEVQSPSDTDRICCPNCRRRLLLQRHFVMVQSVLVDVMQPPPDDPKMYGQQKIVRWPPASA